MVVRIEPDALYDDVTLATELAVSERALRDARRRGDLRFAKCGQRIFHLGQWMIDWIRADGRNATAVVDCPAAARNQENRDEFIRGQEQGRDPVR
jgi:hypothetical protein